MRIVSQDRTLSINFDCCEMKRLGTAIVIHREEHRHEMIGEYDSPERAAEVFEDIHKAYAPVYSISSNLTEDEVRNMIIKSENIAACNILEFGEGKSLTTYSEYVYYMPEK